MSKLTARMVRIGDAVIWAKVVTLENQNFEHKNKIQKTPFSVMEVSPLFGISVIYRNLSSA